MPAAWFPRTRLTNSLSAKVVDSLKSLIIILAYQQVAPGRIYPSASAAEGEGPGMCMGPFTLASLATIHICTAAEHEAGTRFL
jgi:hypothetical protein